MSAWEYRVELVQNKQVTEMIRIELARLLAAAGREGWELVSTESIIQLFRGGGYGLTDGVIVTFKRPIP